MNEFTAKNDLEKALVKAQGGSLAMRDFLRIFLAADVTVASADEVMADGSGFRPLLFHKEGVQMIACFTDLSRLERFRDMAPYGWVMKGDFVIERIAKELGLVINPGESVGFDISPDGIKRIVEDRLNGLL